MDKNIWRSRWSSSGRSPQWNPRPHYAGQVPLLRGLPPLEDRHARQGDEAHRHRAAHRHKCRGRPQPDVQCETDHTHHKYHAFITIIPRSVTSWWSRTTSTSRGSRVSTLSEVWQCDNCDGKNRDIITCDTRWPRNAEIFIFQAPMMRDSDRDFSLPMTCTTKNTGTWAKR